MWFTYPAESGGRLWERVFSQLVFTLFIFEGFTGAAPPCHVSLVLADLSMLHNRFPMVTLAISYLAVYASLAPTSTCLPVLHLPADIFSKYSAV